MDNEELEQDKAKDEALEKAVEQETENETPSEEAPPRQRLHVKSLRIIMQMI